MGLDVIGPEEKAKLKQLINEGCTVMQEIDDLKGGLSDTVKAIAEELDVKASILNKAIRIAHKQNRDEVRADNDLVEDILDAVGASSSNDLL